MTQAQPAAPFIINLSGKVALVTGGSRGIGAAIVSTLAAAGARCAINYVEDEGGQNRADAHALADKLPGSVALAADVGDPARIAAMIQQVQQQFGGLDILVNNAGILRDRSLKKMTADDWDAVLRINLSGAFHCIQQAAPILRPGGRIVNITSVAAFIGIFGQANYASAKAGLAALTRVCAQELARQQITVNAIAPGIVETSILRDMPPEAKQKFLEQVPLGRPGTVDDIAGVVLFLCSPLASYITGQILHVNGGFYMG